jgi:hypothetical protein
MQIVAAASFGCIVLVLGMPAFRESDLSKPVAAVAALCKADRLALVGAMMLALDCW